MKRSKSRLNSFCDSGHNMDIERCQEELLKTRVKYNKLNQKYLELKVEYNKLEKDFRYNIRLMESIIKESNISALSEYLEGPKNSKTYNIKEKEIGNTDNEKIKQNCLSKTTIKILKEKSIYEKLKIEIQNLREELKEKENIIDGLKNNERAIKFRELDNKMALMYQELNEVKDRNNVLETMQVDYVNSKKQIIFLLKQIDLYKKENKKLKELYDKILFDYQNITKQKQIIANSRNLYEEKIKALITRNNGLKIKLEELKNRNYEYYEELENFKNLNQSQIDKILSRKDKEINQYRGQISQLKMEIGNLKNNINNDSMMGLQKMNPIYVKKDLKELRKTDSDFFGENQNKNNANSKKITINSKTTKKSINDNKYEKKIRMIKIKDNKEDISSIRAESKNDINDISNNFYDQNNSVKDIRNTHEKKTTVNDEDINIMNKKIETTSNKKKEKQEILVDIKIEETSKENNINNDNSILKKENNKIKIKNKEKDRKNENIKEKEKNKINIKDEKEEKVKEDRIANIINNKDISEDNNSKGSKKKYNEEEIVLNISKNKDEKSDNSKKNESSSGYNDFDNNIDKKNSSKEDNNSNRNRNIKLNENINVKDTNAISIEPKNDLEKNNQHKLKESNIVDNEQKSESKENNNLNDEKNNKNNENNKKEKIDDNDIQDDFDGLIDEDILI